MATTVRNAVPVLGGNQLIATMPKGWPAEEPCEECMQLFARKSIDNDLWIGQKTYPMNIIPHAQ